MYSVQLAEPFGLGVYTLDQVGRGRKRVNGAFDATIQLAIVRHESDLGRARLLHKEGRTDPLRPNVNLLDDAGLKQFIQQILRGIPMVDVYLPSRLDMARLDGGIVQQLKVNGVPLHAATGLGKRVGEDVRKLRLDGVHGVFRESGSTDGRRGDPREAISQETQVPQGWSKEKVSSRASPPKPRRRSKPQRRSQGWPGGE